MYAVPHFWTKRRNTYPVLHAHHTLICVGCVQWAGGCRAQGSAGGQRQGQLLLQGSSGYGQTGFLFILELLRRICVVMHFNSRVSSTVTLSKKKKQKTVNYMLPYSAVLWPSAGETSVLLLH